MQTKIYLLLNILLISFPVTSEIPIVEKSSKSKVVLSEKHEKSQHFLAKTERNNVFSFASIASLIDSHSNVPLHNNATDIFFGWKMEASSRKMFDFSGDFQYQISTLKYALDKKYTRYTDVLVHHLSAHLTFPLPLYIYRADTYLTVSPLIGLTYYYFKVNQGRSIILSNMSVAGLSLGIEGFIHFFNEFDLTGMLEYMPFYEMEESPSYSFKKTSKNAVNLKLTSRADFSITETLGFFLSYQFVQFKADFGQTTIISGTEIITGNGRLEEYHHSITTGVTLKL